MNFGIFTFNYSIVSFVSRIIGYVRDIFIAFYLGTTIYSDIYAICCRLPFYFRTIIFEGNFNAAFIPTYTSINDDIKKKSFFTSLLIFFLIFFFLLFVILEIYMPNIISIIAPGFNDSEQFELAVKVARITFPYLLFLVVISFLIALLNSHFLFFAAASTHIVLSVVIIFFLFISSKFYQLPIIMVSWGFLASGILQVFFLYLSIRSKIKKVIIFESFEFQKVFQFFNLLWPGLIIYGFTHFNKYVGYYFASFETSFLSYIYFAERIYFIPITIIATSISIILLPFIAKSFKEEKFDMVIYFQRLSIKYCAIFIIPSTFGIIFLSTDIVNVLFERGDFNSLSTKNTSDVLKILTLSMPAYSLMLIMLPYFFVASKLRGIFYSSAVCFITNLILIIYLQRIYGFMSIPISFSITTWIFVISMFFLMKKYNLNFIDQNILKIIFKFVIFSIIMIIFLYISDDLIRIFLKNKTVLLTINILVSTIIFISLFYFFERKTFTELILFYKSRKNKNVELK